MILQSIGNPRPLEQTWTNTLTPAVAKVGGTSDVFNNLDGKGGYVLVGGTNLSGRWGDEVSGPMTGQTAQLRGVLTRDSLGQFEPNYSSPTGAESGDDIDNADSHGYDLSLFKVAYGPGQPFPAWTTDGEKQAYLGVSRFLNLRDPDDVRVDYWYASSVDFGPLISKLQGITSDDIKAKGISGFNGDDLSAVKKQLANEFEDVAQIRHWIQLLQNIYTNSKFANFVNLQSILTDIKNALKPSSSHDVTAEVFAGFSEALYIATEFGEEGPETKALGVIAGAFGLASELASAEHGEPADSDLDTQVSELQEKLEARYKATTDALDRAGDILVSDYGKLITAGSYVQNRWSFNTDSRNALGETLERGAKQMIWKALMRIPYVVDTLNRTDLNTDPGVAQHYACRNIKEFDPYAHEAPNGQQRIVAGFSGSKRQYKLQAMFDSSMRPNGDHVPFSGGKVPPASMVNNLFSSRDDANAVGFYKLEFFQRYMGHRNIHCDRDGNS